MRLAVASSVRRRVSAPATPDAALAEALLTLRRERGHTQEDLAHKAGLTVTAYARIERGSANPTWTTVRRIAKALGVTLGELGGAVEAHADASE
jgi:transcriptional regulator with XRE-family HTH domain